ncbi:MAG: helix-turn-helix domain-containing protein, partial [Bryobacteraceae bacterium]
MKTGRPANTERTGFGERVRAAREAAGLTQQQVAERLGITQPSYALWERHAVALKPDQIASLAKILGARVDDLVNPATTQSRRGGPVGKARRMFEEVNKLPRDRQQHVLRVVEDLLKANRLEQPKA